MSDDLLISGSGSAAVATDELWSSAQSLGRLAEEAASIGQHLAALDRLVDRDLIRRADAPWSAVMAEADIQRASRSLEQIQAQARSVETALNTAAQWYGTVESIAEQLGQRAGEEVGRVTGRLMPFLLSLLIPAAAQTLGGMLLGAAVAKGNLQDLMRSLTGVMRENNEFLTNPVTVSLVRQAAMAGDDVMLGTVGAPPGLTSALGDGGLGMTGLAFSATALMGAGAGLGLLTETRVRLTGTTPLATSGPPAGYSERLGRVPDPGTNGGAQVVIEKYQSPGQPDRFEVYVAGTVTFSPVADTEPWDMTSNVSNAAGEGGGSYAAVAAAMERAGIDADSPVQFTGYSQGGGTAARLAASGDYNTQGLATFGGPTGQVPLPDGFPTVIVEHLDDIVPALGGTQENLHAVIVERDVFGGREIPEDRAVPAHHYEYYQETARLMDDASSEQLTEAIGKLDAFAAGATTVTSTAYRFERD